MCIVVHDTNSTCFTFPSEPRSGAAWVANSSCRGTFGIISLCLSTSIICIWSSVHRDIPLVRLKWIQTLPRDAPLVLVALFAPEVLFYIALNQFLCARELVKTASEKGISEVGGRQKFTLKHGFYAVMGGFTTFIKDKDGSPREAKLTFAGVQALMLHRPELVPDLLKTSISDRSRSNGLGKALLVVQVVWFCVNCISRLSQCLPLSLLELTTFAHGLFTLMSYCMWWHKPLGVDAPTLVKNIPIVETTDPNAPPHFTFKTVPDFRDLFEGTGFKAVIGVTGATEDTSTARVIWDVEPGPTRRSNGTNTTTAIKRWEFRFLDYFFTAGIPIVYGILHFLGRKSHFPTMIEQKMWGVMSLVVMLAGTVFAAEDALVGFTRDCLPVKDKNPKIANRAKRIKKRIVHFDRIIAFCVIPCIYSLAAGFLLVESIRQLWYLPSSGYVVASWSYYVPHWL